MAMTDNYSSEQFALRWNNFSYNLSSGFSSHLNTKNLVDVTLAVEGQLLEAHKLVLSVCSPYFEDIFKTNPCQHPIVILQDMKYSEVDALVKFMYKGEVNVKQDDLSGFLKVAAALKVKGLTLDSAILQNTSTSAGISQNPNASYTNEFSDIDNTASQTHTNIKEKTKKHNQTSISPTISKRIRKSSITHDSTERISKAIVSPETQYEIASVNDIKTVYINDNSSLEHSITIETMSNDGSIDLTNGDDNDEFCENSELFNANITDNSSQQCSSIEPVTYRLSARGRPQLVHGGYVYNLTSRSAILNRSHYRCTEQHRGCRGKCAVIAERFMPTGVNDHNHLPSYQSETDYKKKRSHELE